MTVPPLPPADVGGRRVALVHDWLTGLRGGEKALNAIRRILPDATLFTLLHVRGSVSAEIDAAHPRQTFLRYLPFVARHYRRYIPLFPIAVEQFDLDPYDLVVSTSHCAVKSVVVPGRARHLCYCFTPMRYAWDQFDAYFGPARVGETKSRLYRRAFQWLARWDADTANRVHRFVAISRHVADRIRRYYNRTAIVVYPPVDTTFFTPDGSDPGPYFVVVSALVPYKRIDVAIDACRLARVPLKIVGDGPERRALEAAAGPDTEFLGSLTDSEVRELYRGSRGLILPGEEDFGIAPVEAAACGRPVVGLARGGATETVHDGVTGVLVERPDPRAFAEGLARLEQARLEPAVIREHALRFSYERFHEEMRATIEETVAAPRHATW